MALNKDDDLRKRLKALENLKSLTEDKLDIALSAMLYRQDCPDKMTLGDYALGLLETDEQARLDHHLAVCPHCRSEMAHFAQSLTRDDLLTALGVVPAVKSGAKPAAVPDPNWVEQVFDYGRAWLERESGRWRQVIVPLSILSDLSGLSGFGGEANLMPAQPELMSEMKETTEKGSLTVAPDEANFELGLNVSPDPVTTTGDSLCQLVVMLTCLDRFGDFSGIQVVLAWGEQVYTQKTDPLGEVTFSQLPCDRLAEMDLTVTFPVAGEQGSKVAR